MKEKHWNNGDRYLGQWKDSKKHGFGTYYWSTGDVYKGEWLDGQQHGYGEFTWASGAVYRGHFRNNLRNDEHGIFEWPNGDKYSSMRD